MVKKSTVKNQAASAVSNKTEGRREYDVTPERFVEVWQSSNSADEVAQKLGMPKPIVHARASSYRQAGIKLKKMQRHSTRGLDVERLNHLIESMKGGRGKVEAQDENEGLARSKRRAEPINPEAVQAVVEKVMENLHVGGKRRD